MIDAPCRHLIGPSVTHVSISLLIRETRAPPRSKASLGVKVSPARWTCNIRGMDVTKRGKYRRAGLSALWCLILYLSVFPCISCARGFSCCSLSARRNKGYKDRKSYRTHSAGTSKPHLHQPCPLQHSKTTRRLRLHTSNRATHGLTMSTTSTRYKRATCWTSRASTRC
jgi:hypothetical protein